MATTAVRRGLGMSGPRGSWNGRRFGALAGLLLGFSITTMNGDEPVYQPAHKGNQLAGFEVVQVEHGCFRLRATRATQGRIVISADAPVELVSAQGLTAKLVPGWDGSLDCAHYGIEVVFAAAGEGSVTVRALPPPEQPMVDTAADFAAFKQAFEARASRVPDQGFADWQRQYRAKLAELLMGGGIPERIPLEVKVIETKDYPQFTLRRIVYRSRPERTNEALLSLPKGVAKAPLLVALHGHENDWGQAAEKAYTMGNADDFCAYFAERGWAVLQPATMNHQRQDPQWTLQGEWSWDAMVAIDYAATVPEVDMSRATVCGLSTGAHLAMNVLALDSRIRAGVVGCIFSTWNHYRRRVRIPPNCECGIMAQLGDQLEQCDWAAIAAPKPVQFQQGRKDPSMCPGANPNDLIPGNQWVKSGLCANTGIMPQAEYDLAFAEVRRAYRLAGGTDALVNSHIHDGPHRVDNAAAFAWLTKAIAQP